MASYAEDALQPQFGTGEPILGAKKNKPWLPFPETTIIKYYTGCVTDEETRNFLSLVATNSFKCGGILTKKGDCCIISETGSFDKEGNYFVVLKYAELPEDVKHGDKKNN